MKNNSGNKTIRRTTALALSGLSILSLVGVGTAGWIIAGGPAYLNGITMDAGQTSEISADDYFYQNAVTKTENLQVNDSGFVYDDDVGTIGHIIYHLIFDPVNYLKAFSKTSENIYFLFSLSYKTYQSGYTLIDDYLTGSIKVWDSGTTYIASGTELAQTKLNHTASCDTSANPISITSSKPVTYITLDYKFDVGSNFNSIKSNELASSPTFVLTANVGIKS